MAALGLKPDGGRPTSPARPTSATVEGYGREENAVAAAAAVALAAAVDAALDAASAGSFSPLPIRAGENTEYANQRFLSY